MTLTQFLTGLFLVLIIGVALPVPYGVRMALFLALVVLAVLTFIGGGMHFLMSFF